METALESDQDAPPLDPGPNRGRHGVQRTCIVTREIKAPAEMIRFVRAPDGSVVPDLRARLPGRGAWVGCKRETVEAAVKRRQFRRAFRSEQADPAPGLADAIAGGLREDLRQAIALANKAGCVVAGFAKVEAAIGASGGVAAVVHAREASEDGRRKLTAALRRRYGEIISTIPVIDDLSGAELDMALGRDHVIHAALVAGAGSNGSLARWRRLRAFEGVAPTLETGPAFAGATAFAPLDDDTTDRPGPMDGPPADGTTKPRLG